MKTPKRHSGLFDLPILLSFNELAWILIFVMALFCANTLLKLKSTGLKHEKDVSGAKAEVKDLSRELEKAQTRSNELIVINYELSRQLQTIRNLLSKKNDEIGQLSTDLAQAKKNADALTEEVNQLNTALQELEARLADANRRNLELEQTNAKNFNSTDLTNTTPPNESVVRQELLGLKGGMTNVIVLLDRSGSMEIGNRWGDTLTLVGTWLQYLPVKRCALITFSDRCDFYPHSGLLTMTGDEGLTNRIQLIRQLRGLEPDGNTDTLSALQNAYSYAGEDKADTIILFTDGAPHVPSPGDSRTDEEKGGKMRYTPGQMKAVLALVKTHPDIPVNVVGLGSYYEDKILPEFMIDISKETQGVFIGR